ncbi:MULTISPECIES: glutathione S-transferase [Rhodomicrobium]|uniref:glutathione S-transferase family protein n=1 Tax=Rhodomicrobium TaxID=1068 RepID=UPI000B4A58D8|nr:MULTISPECIES: glutathione S-transferase [Rhodomicrobium]
MAEYKLHCFAQSGNAYKAALMLALSGADWQAVPIDYFNGETRQPDWRQAVNAMGEAPVLEHGGRRLSQSGVILSYLARRTGKFGPESEEEELEILRWILFDNHKFTSYLATYRFQIALMPQTPNPDVLKFLRGRIDPAFAVVEAHLGTQPFIAGARPTIADISLSGYVFYPPEELGYDFKETHPNIFAWSERIKALPGWVGPYELMPGERFMAQR